jgi:hypothetical protein
MKHKMLSLALAAALMFIAVLAPVAAEAAPKTPTPVNIPATGSGTTATGLPVNFSGTATISKFVVQNGQVLAQGVLNGVASVTNADGTVTSLPVANQAISLPVNQQASAQQAGCNILNLVLGPLSLNLLGLQVNLNQIVLDITAVPGAGNLLGNLLCAVANLLNGAGNLNALSVLLNNILNLLSGL